MMSGSLSETAADTETYAATEDHGMYYLYGSKPGVERKLAATFDSEQQLLAYVRWATLSEKEGLHKFEQGSALVGYQGWSSSTEPLTDEDPQLAPHNPSPSML